MKGVKFDAEQQTFSLDFEHDGKEDIVHLLRTLRILNEDNTITIFSLIGRKDLMAESM